MNHLCHITWVLAGKCSFLGFIIINQIFLAAGGGGRGGTGNLVQDPQLFIIHTVI